MALMKLRPLDGSSVGITIPKDDLREAGLIGEDGELLERPHVAITWDREAREWNVELDPLDELGEEASRVRGLARAD